MNDEVLVRVEGVSKKFCRSLQRSLWYGLQDVGTEMFGQPGHHDQLRKNEFWAVDDISFELKRGECLGLIGPNGAGKSTLLKMLNGLVKPDKGRITMRGRVGALIELGAGFNPILTARENIYVNGAVLGLTKKEIDRKFDAIVDFAELDEFIDTPVQNFSSGMKVRLGFAVAAEMEPDILLIDEVLAVGDFHFRQKCFGKLSDLRSSKAMIFVSHAMDIVRMFSDRSIVLHRGHLICDSDPQKAIEQYLRAALGNSGVEGALSKVGVTPIEGDIYWNRDKIASASHRWNSATFRHGERMVLDFSIRFKSPIRNLIIGVPIWDGNGLRVTAFNSDYTGFHFNSNETEVSGRLESSCLLNPGDYSSVITVHDGPEILYRQLLDPIAVASDVRLFGVCSFPQVWSERAK